MAGNAEAENFMFDGEEIPFGTHILFCVDAVDGLQVACEICEDVWAAETPSTSHAMAGATVIVNLSASNETVGKGCLPGGFDKEHQRPPDFRLCVFQCG